MGHSMQAAHKYREKSANHPSLRPKRHTNSTFLHLLVGNFSDFTLPTASTSGIFPQAYAPEQDSAALPQTPL